MSDEFDIKSAIRKVVDGSSLTFEEAGLAMDQIMIGQRHSGADCRAADGHADPG